jgi:hypothetical protein
LASGAAAGDIVELEVFGNFAGQSGAEVSITGGSITGLTNFESAGIDDNASSTAITLDSSGNLLVGQSAVGVGSVGGTMYSTGQGKFTSDGVQPLYLNRLTSDGTILDLRKDGSTVGSIGASSGNIGVLSASTGKLGTGTTYYYGWDDTRVYPLADNSKDLGLSSYRWKDLYLSGGVYLGGTGSANHLDDYESGTWTPTLLINFSDTGVSYAFRSGYYTKVGNLVQFQGRITLSSKGSGTGNLMIGSLPFSPTYVWSGMSFGYASGTSSTWNNPLIPTIDPGQSTVKLRYIDSNGYGQNFTNTSISNAVDLIFFGSYMTSA